jgi:hypothetical protein
MDSFKKSIAWKKYPCLAKDIKESEQSKYSKIKNTNQEIIYKNQTIHCI